MAIDEEVLGTWRALLSAHARVHRRINVELAAEGLPDLSWYDLLWAIYRQPNRRLRVNQIAQEVALSPTATSRFVDRVEAAGYVRREPDPEDRRALQIVLTDEGIELLRRMWPVYERGIQRYVGDHLGRSARTVRTALERMAEAAR
jgi:DNA-binding MarR family transcriptional regulator